MGVLSLQGDFLEHLKYFSSLAKVREVRNKSDLDGLDAIVFPGGESTTIGKMLKRQNLRDLLIKKIKGGLLTLGTCAGSIILGRGSEYSMNLIDLEVERNAYGRQLDSFEVKLDISSLGEDKFSCCFIRAPKFSKVGKGVEVLASYKRFPIFVRQKNIVCTSFHPELADDRFAEFFCGLRL